MIGSLTARLLDVTAEDHGGLETSPFQVALKTRSLPRLKLYQLLQAHHAIDGALERCIRSSDNAMLCRLWQADMAKSQLLAADLRTVGAGLPHVSQTVPPAVMAAIAEYVQYIEHAACMQPLALAGYLFAREGSMLGAPALRYDVAAIVGGVPGVIRYYDAYLDPMDNWRTFRRSLEAEVVTVGQQNVVVAGGRDAFRLLRQLYETLSEDAPCWPSLTASRDEYGASDGMGIVVARSRRETTAAMRAYTPS